MKYIYITQDAIEIFASIRQYQNIDFDESKELYNVLIGKSDTISNRNISLHKNSDGLIIYTNKINKKNGLHFDLTTFDAFINQSEAKTIIIFQKVIKCAIRYFNNLNLAPCEKLTADGASLIIYPFPFTATKNVYKVLIDRNTSKYARKDMKILTVYFSGSDGDKYKVSFTTLNKSIEELKEISITEKSINKPGDIDTFSSTTLEDISLTIDSAIGYDKWNDYLTITQKSFINKPVSGVERLEGAAGTGKTLSMILRCVHLLKEDASQRIVFITHSKATCEHIIHIFKNNWPECSNLLCTTENINKPLLITTLQEWCIKFLGVYLTDTEYLDKDAQDSKILQSLYIEEAYNYVKEKDWSTYKKICSQSFIEAIEKTDLSLMVEMLQYEIATIIKGRADGDLDKYKKIKQQQYSIPYNNEYDKSFIYLIYKNYQENLEKLGQYDSDDIILTALGQLNTPIWKRRRNKEGFKACFIDETHLFNLNELSIIHYLNQDDSKNNIVFAIDKSQHIGERGILDDTMYDILKIKSEINGTCRYDVVFRNSTEIMNLAYNILSSGAAVFQHFENPLIESSVVMSNKEDDKCINPEYYLLPTDQDIIEKAFEEADRYSKKNNINKSRILITSSSSLLLDEIIEYAQRLKKPHSVLKSLGDAIYSTNPSEVQHYILGNIEYVGGLEFDYVIVVGVDASRVPPKSNNDSFHFMNYAWHNKMYVATTRAKYAILFLGNKSFGASPILESALELGILEFRE